MNVKGLIRQFGGSRRRTTGTTPTPRTGRTGGAGGGGGDEVVRGVKKLLRNRKR